MKIERFHDVTETIFFYPVRSASRQIVHRRVRDACARRIFRRIRTNTYFGQKERKEQEEEEAKKKKEEEEEEEEDARPRA